MGFQQVVRSCLPVLSPRRAAQIENEIREELEFHLEMRTRDNMRLGMSPDDARRNARERFGDFEANRQACRQITLGSRIMLQRIQTAMLVVLLLAVAGLGFGLVQMQTATRDQVESLTALIEQLSEAQDSGSQLPATMPYVKWSPTAIGAAAADGDVAARVDPADWGSAEYSSEQPWSDWGPLDEGSDEQ